MIALRALALGAYLLLGQQYPPEIGLIGDGFPIKPRIQNAAQPVEITGTRGAETQVIQTAEVKATTSQLPQITETTTIPDSTSKSTSQVSQPSKATVVVEESASPVRRSSKAIVTEESARRAEQSSEARVVKHPVSQAKPEWVDPAIVSSVCDFKRLRLASQLLQPPYDIADNVNMATVWEPVANQLSEITLLINYHWPTLVKLYGYEEMIRLHDSLVEWVEKPLKYGCSTLENLQATLISLVHSSEEPRSVRKGLLMDALRKYETEMLDHLANEELGLRIPGWARQAQEFQSDYCANEDCFSIGLHPIDLVTAEIPQSLLRAVRELQENMNPGVYQIMKLIGKRTWRALVWCLSLFGLLWTQAFLTNASLAVIFATLYRLWVGGYHNIEVRRMGVGNRRRNNNQENNNG